VDHCNFTGHHYQATSIKLASFSLQLLVIQNHYTWCHINLHFTNKFDGHVGKSHPTVILCDTDFKRSLQVWFIKAGKDSSSIAWRQFGGCKPSAKHQETKCLLCKTAVTHSNTLENSGFLRCDTILWAEWLWEIWRIMVLSSLHGLSKILAKMTAPWFLAELGTNDTNIYHYTPEDQNPHNTYCVITVWH